MCIRDSRCAARTARQVCGCSSPRISEFCAARQTRDLPVPGWRALAPRSARLQAGDERPLRPGPVSYTHLDVYKRQADTDVALLSTVDYATNSAGTTFGKGLELRLVAGELEFRYADRFPAYSIRVRSEGAGISAGQWQHVTLIYEGEMCIRDRPIRMWHCFPR